MLAMQAHAELCKVMMVMNFNVVLVMQAHSELHKVMLAKQAHAELCKVIVVMQNYARSFLLFKQAYARLYRAIRSYRLMQICIL